MQTARPALAVVGVLIGLAHMGSAIAATSANDGARRIAEEMAAAASKEFSAFEERQRLAQADTTRPDKMGLAPLPADPSQWLRYSRDRFQLLMRLLAGERRPVQPWDPVAEASRKAGAEPAKTIETKEADAVTPAPAQPSAPVPVASAGPPAEERKLAEIRRAAPDKREADGTKGKVPVKGEAAKGADPPKPADAKSRAADAETVKTPAPKAVDAARPPAKDAAARPAEAPRAAAPESMKADASKKADAPKSAEAPAAAPPAAEQIPAPGKVAPVPKATPAVPPASRPARQEAAAPKTSPEAQPPPAKPAASVKAADPSKAAAPVAIQPAPRQEPADKQREPAKEPGAKVAAREPAIAKPEMPTGIPIDVKAPAARSKAKRRAGPRVAAACRSAGRRASPGNWYTVREGDSLWLIARRHLGAGRRYRRVHAANRRSIADADHIYPCQRIYIPRRSAHRRS